MDTNPRFHHLTAREREIAGLIADGHTNAEIAERLGISFWTAKWHVSEIISKLGVESREEVAAAWRREHSLRGRLGRAPAGILGSLLGRPMVPFLAGALVTLAGAFLVFAIAGGAGDGRLIFAEADDPPLALNALTTATPTNLPGRAGQYAVQQGETCPDIALRYGISPSTLLAWNPSLGPSCNIQPGMLLNVPPLSRGSPDPANMIWLADLDGDPAAGYIAGIIDPIEGLFISQFDATGAPITSGSGRPFRQWEVFIASAATADRIGGQIAVVGSDRVARIDMVVDGGAPTPYTPVIAPAALGYPLRILYITLPAGQIWEFWAYDDAGNHIGTVAHGSSLGAGETYVDKIPPGGPTATPPGPRLDAIDANSNGHVLRIWPEDRSIVTQAETAPSLDPLVRNGVCAEIAEEARGPAISLANVEFWVDQEDVTSQLTRYIDDDPATPASGVLCFSPEGGLAPGPHDARIMLHTSADRQRGMLGHIWWQFEVVAPATPTPASN